MCHHRYSHIEGRHLLVGLGSAAASGPRGRRRLPAQGHCRRSPSGSGAATTDLGITASTPDRGTAATARRGRGADSRLEGGGE
jgi:hypothetical protein